MLRQDHNTIFIPYHGKGFMAKKKIIESFTKEVINVNRINKDIVYSLDMTQVDAVWLPRRLQSTRDQRTTM